MNTFWLVKYEENQNILKKIKLELSSNIDDYTFNELNVLTHNDRHKSFEIEINNLNALMFVVEHPTEIEKKVLNKSEINFKIETYDDYINKKESIKESNYKWIYNIIDSITNNNLNNRIIYHDSFFFLVTDFLWDQKNINTMHILGVVLDKNIMTIRDLNKSHLNLLKHILINGKIQIEQKYNINKNKIKVFFHYPPSTWLLHIHFMNIELSHKGTDFARCIKLSDVIKNIELDENYYKSDMEILDTH